MVRGLRIGDYQVEQELDGSPFAQRYRAVHSVLPRRALVKVARTVEDGVAVLREACILAALPHPGIVHVYETGRLPDHRTWFAYELVDGLTLAGAFHARTVGDELGSIEPVVAVGMIRDVAEVLAFAHQRGVIHAGITPERLIIVGRGRGFPMCVADWSAARTHDALPVAAEPGPFVAPELALGETIDDRVDVYALGVVAYRALTGTLPFEQGAAGEEPVPAEVHCPDAPRELTQLIDQMIEHDRWDRPSAAEARAELAWLAADLAKPGSLARPPDIVRIRKPRWTPQVDLGTRMRAETEQDPGILPGTRDDPH